MTHTELALLAALIGILGVGGGKLWGNAKIKEMRDYCLQCHSECKRNRISKEHEMELVMQKIADTIAAELKALKKGQAEVKDVLEKQAAGILALQKSYGHISGWMERNGKMK